MSLAARPQLVLIPAQALNCFLHNSLGFLQARFLTLHYAWPRALRACGEMVSGANWPGMNAAPSAYTPPEELANAITHGFGVALSIVGLVLLLVTASRHGDAWGVSSSAVFGATLILLYSVSTLYHSLPGARRKFLLRKCDHAAIFLLIAGTYTPVLLVSLRGAWGWSLFGVIWGLAAAGVAMKFWFTGRFGALSMAIYIAMGWLVVVALRPVLHAVPLGGLLLLLAGGLCYTGGTVFYAWKKLPYHHAVWHLWVLAGSACHWAAVYCYIVPTRA